MSDAHLVIFFAAATEEIQPAQALATKGFVYRQKSLVPRDKRWDPVPAPRSGALPGHSRLFPATSTKKRGRGQRTDTQSMKKELSCQNIADQIHPSSSRFPPPWWHGELRTSRGSTSRSGRRPGITAGLLVELRLNPPPATDFHHGKRQGVEQSGHPMPPAGTGKKPQHGIQPHTYSYKEEPY